MGRLVTRQSKYRNNTAEQDHRRTKRIVRPTLGFKTLHCASILIAGIETMHMIRQGAARLPQRPRPVLGKSIILPGRLNGGRARALASTSPAYGDRTL
ncbi:DDE domain-containing protein [Methylovirgula sp. 4M-Z18]|nr:DDE domain-containing protein [Methylovirgula sp. 4M-Z18]